MLYHVYLKCITPTMPEFIVNDYLDADSCEDAIKLMKKSVLATSKEPIEFANELAILADEEDEANEIISKLFELDSFVKSCDIVKDSTYSSIKQVQAELKDGEKAYHISTSPEATVVTEIMNDKVVDVASMSASETSSAIYIRLDGETIELGEQDKDPFKRKANKLSVYNLGKPTIEKLSKAIDSLSVSLMTSKVCAELM